jgi:hypothetical protein
MMEEKRGRCCPSSCPIKAEGGALTAVQQHLLPMIKIEAEERPQQIGHTISPSGCPDTPLHITEFDDSYMRDNHDVFELRAP